MGLARKVISITAAGVLFFGGMYVEKKYHPLEWVYKKTSQNVVEIVSKDNLAEFVEENFHKLPYDVKRDIIVDGYWNDLTDKDRLQLTTQYVGSKASELAKKTGDYIKDLWDKITNSINQQP